MSDNEITELEYRAEVESQAEDIVRAIEEYPEDYRDDPHQAIHENVDPHEWVINNWYLLDVLKHSERGPEEWYVYVDDDEKNHYEVLRAMAYTAFRADVTEATFDLADELGVDLR